jgi:tetratricopeptide (TPR) repeat protein
MGRGDYPTADRCYRHSLWLRRSISDRRAIAATLHNAAISRSRQRDWVRAHSLYERCLGEWRSAGEERFIPRLTANLGVIAAEQGDYEAAQRHFQEGLDAARRFGETRGIAICLRNLGHTNYKLGDYEKAENLLAGSLIAARELKDYVQAGSSLLCLGLVRSARAALQGGRGLSVPAEQETGPQFLRIAVELYQELNVPLPRYAAAEMERFPAAAHRGNGFPFTGLRALQEVLERWLPEHAV